MKPIEALNEEILKEEVKILEESIKKEIIKKSKSCYFYLKNTANYDYLCDQLTEAGYAFTKNGEAITITLK